MQKFIYFLFAALLITMQAFAQASFSAKTDVPSGNLSYSVAIGDFNLDGKPDLAVMNQGDATMSVLLSTTNPGDATPSFSSAASFTLLGTPRYVAAGDLNGDGKPDIAVTDGVDGEVSVFINKTNPGDAAPSFSVRADYSVGSGPYQVAIGDLNGDGKPDLVVANSSDNTLSVLLNTTTAGDTTSSFSTHQDFATGTFPIEVAIGDINGDGVPDLVTANHDDGSVSVLINLTSPGAASLSFTNKTDFTVVNTSGHDAASVSLSDFNGDGKEDICATSYTEGIVAIFLNTTTPGDTTPTFSTKTDLTGSAGYIGVVAKDLNDDGLPDIAVGNESGYISVFLNKTTPGASTASFTTNTDFITASNSTILAVGDLNGDYKPDLAIAAHNTIGTVSVLFNTMTLGTSPASFSGKTDFTAKAGAYFVGSGDLNMDGKPDLIMGYRDEGDSISVFLSTINPGNATPSFSTREDFNIGASPYAAAIGDINGDGKPDLIVANTGGYASVFINETSPGASTLTFSSRYDFSTYGGPWFVQLADINGDGKPDIVTASTAGYSSVLLNTTTPGSTTPSFSSYSQFRTGNYSTHVSIGDLNLDGKPDFAVPNDNSGSDSLSNSISVLLNTTATGAATASFATERTYKVGTNPTNVIIADINGDGKPDMIVNNSGNSTVSILMNTTTPGASSPSFSDTTDFPTGSGPFSVYVADVNGDGMPDIVTPNANDNTVSVLLNTTSPGASTPSFASETDFATGRDPSFVTIVDLNGDGKPDLAVANQTDSTLSVLFNSESFPLPVELTTFTANNIGDKVDLKWNTSTEVNNYGFEVQRTIKNSKLKIQNFEKIGFVKGSGNSNSPKNYSFKDDNPPSGNIEYRLKQIDNNGNFKYSQIATLNSLPTKFELWQNYPNPFNPTTTINYDLPQQSKVVLKVYDILGQEVATLVNKEEQAGVYTVQFSPNNYRLASGVYIYRLTAGSFSETKKMNLLK